MIATIYRFLTSSVRSTLMFSGLALALLAPSIVMAQETASPPVSSELKYPLALAKIGEDGLVIVDLDARTIQRWGPSEGLKRLAEGPATLRKPLNRPRCVAVGPGGEVYVGCSAGRDVFRINEAGEPIGLTGGLIGIPISIAVRSDGSLLVSDLETRRLLSVPAAGGSPTVVRPLNARGIAVAADDSILAVLQEGDQLVKLSSDGKDMQPMVPGRPFEFPHNVLLAADGTAYVTDGYRKAIWSVAPGGSAEVWFEGEPLQNPVGVALLGDRLIVADPHAKQLFAFPLSKEPPTALLPSAP